MKNRFYLLGTALLVAFTLSVSEARTGLPDAGAPDGPYLGTGPAMNAQTTPLRMAEQGALSMPMTTRGKVSENESPKPEDRLKLPKQDTTQSGEQGQIFDRWGNSKNKGSK